MQKPVLVLDYSTDRKSGDNIGRWLKGSVRVLHVQPADAFPVLNPRDFRAVVHSGSALSINDDHPFIAEAEAFVRRASGELTPQMGICYGHQLLARALCGKGAVSRCPSIEVGWVPVEFLSPWPGDGLAGRKLAVWQSHYDRVNEIPKDSLVTATNEHTEIQAFFNRELGLFGTQFHPEFDRESGNMCFRDDPELFEKNGIDLNLVLQGGPDFNTGRVVFSHFLKAFEQE